MHHLRKIGIRVCQYVALNIHVNNVQCTYPTEKLNLNFYEESKRMFIAASFPLVEWFTNSAPLSEVFFENGGDVASEEKAVGFLGMCWNRDSD